jgi:S-adenosylmethionine-diacylgycerolhomoserine-N-methlytransferase
MSLYSSDIDADTSWPVEATDRMNRMYRRQRHIYDGTRRYYLLGRDQMIAGLQPTAHASVLRLRYRKKPCDGRPAISRRAIFRNRCFD